MALTARGSNGLHARVDPTEAGRPIQLAAAMGGSPPLLAVCRLRACARRAPAIAAAQPSARRRGYSAAARSCFSIAATRRRRDRQSETAPAVEPGAVGQPRQARPSSPAHDDKGRWRMVIPAAGDVRLFGLSDDTPGERSRRRLSGAARPAATAAQLRAGSGARVFVAHGAGVALLAADFDRKGGRSFPARRPRGLGRLLTVDGRRAAWPGQALMGAFCWRSTNLLSPARIRSSRRPASSGAKDSGSRPCRRVPADGPFQARHCRWRLADRLADSGRRRADDVALRASGPGCVKSATLGAPGCGRPASDFRR